MAEKKRDDDSLNAATAAIDSAQTRISQIENALTSPDQLGQLASEAVKHSTILRKELKNVMFELLDDYDNRKQLEAVIAKIDRAWLASFAKKIGWAIGAIILALISGLAGYFIHK